LQWLASLHLKYHVFRPGKSFLIFRADPSRP
jgi:hypothetical protein